VSEARPTHSPIGGLGRGDNGFSEIGGRRWFLNREEITKRDVKKTMHQGRKTSQKYFGKTTAKIIPSAAKPQVQRLRRKADFFDMGALTTF